MIWPFERGFTSRRKFLEKRGVSQEEKIQQLNERIDDIRARKQCFAVENKALAQDYGLLEISRDHERTLRASCEQALSERDANLEKLRAENEQLSAQVIRTQDYALELKAENEALKDQITLMDAKARVAFNCFWNGGWYVNVGTEGHIDHGKKEVSSDE